MYVLVFIPGYVMADKLVPCPERPNCVSSMEHGKDVYIEPLRYSDALTEAKQKLLAVIHNQPRTQVLIDDVLYLHVTFTSLLFRFVDDVEFTFDDSQKLIHVRSASRKGHYDFGVNRRRVEMLRKAFQES
jgi:uncharacterized protein (DUF1499 family)